MIYKHGESGLGSILVTAGANTGRQARLISVSAKFDVAPTTAGRLTVTLDALAGSEYDTVLYSVDLATATATNLFYQPDQPTWIVAGDVIKVEYANTDKRLYGVQITMESV